MQNAFDLCRSYQVDRFYDLNESQSVHEAPKNALLLHVSIELCWSLVHSYHTILVFINVEYEEDESESKNRKSCCFVGQEVWF